MIVSHKHKYVFIQSPHTGCTAVGRELVDFYDGEPMLFKHAAYHDFLRAATPAMKQYFVFSTVRNPIDELVSFYYKLKSNHGEDFTRPERLKINGGWVTPRIIKRYQAVQDENLSFIDYLARFYRMPHVNWTVLDHKKFDYVMRYESLQDDFSVALNKLGIEQLRSIPVVNPTKKDNDDIISTLTAEELETLAWVIGPLLDYWDYPAVSDNNTTIPNKNKLAFDVMCLVKKTYWRYIRHLT